ncbi:CDP-alcohol phosphatidyltransferase family protein [Novosphingobium album (ex Liu et al. 2023)]|uniref:CDP-alcohol phosphatidyltransferase family protein n=1 Tax=Novosphingobium album (ex Liu et al. 2023) TaxID=3031130 RepID=A0ABT5WME5_9SPHN|nr:CDP-alcohol phosphatidyltransferase family protein [Novosphingobium album (ex Liu et al. 2023)]MDE8650861.1 CDP-alcohol phosphatidyltransferase family protein [Novosphingobium album (ex Liu et al. 2023)]
MNATRNKTPTTITRVQQNLLASTERKVLDWLCARMPNWVMPDLLTALGLAGAALVLAGYASSLSDEQWLWLCIVGYVIHWFGDSMDGSLARFRHIERPRYGYFLDHSCDGIATLLILLGIGLSPYVRLDVALIALVGYLLLSVHAFLAVRVFGEMRLSYLAAGPTELRVILIGLTLAMLVFGDSDRNLGVMTGFDYFVGGVGIVLIALFVIQTIKTSRALASVDPR